MMTLGAWLLEGLLGRWLRVITIPVLFMGALTFAKVAWDKRDARLLKEGERICDARWENEVRRQEQDKAARQALAAQLVLEQERQMTEGLREQLQSVTEQMDRLRATSSSDRRCLSDGVLNALRNGKEGGGKKDRPK